MIKAEQIHTMYDVDTSFGIPNNYCDYVYDVMLTSKKHDGPRGEYYNLVLIKDNKIIAFGDEQGNYAGGIYCSTVFNYQRFVEELDRIKKYYPDLYEQAKIYPLAKENEYPPYKKK